MPMSLDLTGTGYMTFCAVKWVGYTIVSKRIGEDYPESPRPAMFVGLTRTLIGMGVGGIYSFMFLDVLSVPVYWAGLVPIRLLEWGFVIWLFHGRKNTGAQRGFSAAIFGTFWSYVLDIPAAIGFLATGGLSIC